jgi:cytochrome c-type biogenesis protein CcmH
MTVITAVIRGLVMLFPIIMMVSMPPAARAITAEEMLADPALETRARTLSKQLRCLVCQNQSIDDSDADLARDLRREVRTQILTGADDETILTQLRAKYGDYVLLNPPVDRATLALWFAPVAFIALGGLLVLAARRQKQAAPAILDPEDRERVDRLMRQRRQKGRPKR